MSIQVLSKLVHPPNQPIHPGVSGEWLRVEQMLGTQLPSDYKEYIETYGSGTLLDFITPFNPFDTNEYVNLVAQARIRLGALRVLKEKYGEKECPYSLYPEVGGLLPWGATNNGDVFFWLTENDPDNWQVVINESRGPKFEQYPDSMTDFLQKIISGSISSQIMPEDLLEGDIDFRPME